MTTVPVWEVWYDGVLIGLRHTYGDACSLVKSHRITNDKYEVVRIDIPLGKILEGEMNGN